MLVGFEPRNFVFAGICVNVRLVCRFTLWFWFSTGVSNDSSDFVKLVVRLEIVFIPIALTSTTLLKKRDSKIDPRVFELIIF